MVDECIAPIAAIHLAVDLFGSTQPLRGKWQV